MSKKPSFRDLDDSFNVLYVVITLISGFLFVQQGIVQNDLIFKFYFGLNLIPIIILGLVWWISVFFNKIVLKMFSWFMIFSLLFQSILLILASLFPSIPFYLFPFTPIIAIPFIYAVYKRYVSVGEKVTKTQQSRIYYLCAVYSFAQMFWYLFLIAWLIVEFLRIVFK